MTPLLDTGPVNDGSRSMLHAGRSFWAAVFRHRELRLASAVLAFVELDVEPHQLLEECLYSCLLCAELTEDGDFLPPAVERRLEGLRELLELQSRLWEDDVALDVPVKKERHRVKDVVEMMLKEKRAAAHIIRSVVRAEKNGHRANFSTFSKFESAKRNSLEEAVDWLRRNHWQPVDAALTRPTRQAYHWALAPTALSIVVAQHTPFFGPPREHSLKKVFGDLDRPMFVSCTVPFLLPGAMHLGTYLVSACWHSGPGFVGDLYIGLAEILVGISSPLCDAICTDSSGLPEQHPIYGNEVPFITWPNHTQIRANSWLNNWSRGFDRATAVMVVPTSLLVYLAVTQDWPALTRAAAAPPPWTLLAIFGTFAVGNASCLVGQKARARDPVGRRSRAARLFRFQHAVLWHGCLGVLLTASFASRKVPWTQHGARLSEQRLAALSEHVAGVTGGISLTGLLGGIATVYTVFNVVNTVALVWKEFWTLRRSRQGALYPGELDR